MNLKPIEDLTIADLPRHVMLCPGGPQQRFMATDLSCKTGLVEDSVLVDEKAASIFSTRLLVILSAGWTPYLDVCHLSGPAAAWVLEAFWSTDPAPGIWGSVVWTTAGADAILRGGCLFISPCINLTEDSPRRFEAVSRAMPAVGGVCPAPGFVNNRCILGPDYDPRRLFDEPAATSDLDPQPSTPTDPQPLK